MKTKILTLAAAAAISLGAASLATPASAATSAFNANGLVTASESNVQNVHYRPYFHRHVGYNYRRCKRLYRLGFRYGYPWAKRAYYRYCRIGYGYRYKCRKWYIAGFKYGSFRARKLWYRYCAKRPIAYPYGPYFKKPHIKVKIGF